MTYQIKTIFPKEETAENNKLTERTINEFIVDMDSDEVKKYYNSLLVRGYSIGVKFTPPELSEEGKEQDPFAIAKKFELAGIPYKATLKLKAKADYESIVKIAKLIEQQDYDYDISAKLMIRENSSVDFERLDSWFDKDYTKYTILPKASSQDIMDLKSLRQGEITSNPKTSQHV